MGWNYYGNRQAVCLTGDHPQDANASAYTMPKALTPVSAAYAPTRICRVWALQPRGAPAIVQVCSVIVRYLMKRYGGLSWLSAWVHRLGHGAEPLVLLQLCAFCDRFTDRLEARESACA